MAAADRRAQGPQLDYLAEPWPGKPVELEISDGAEAVPQLVPFQFAWIVDGGHVLNKLGRACMYHLAMYSVEFRGCVYVLCLCFFRFVREQNVSLGFLLVYFSSLVFASFFLVENSKINCFLVDLAKMTSGSNPVL